MNPIKKLHREAMELFDQAEVARIRGGADDVGSLLLQAYKKEREAAELVKDQFELEPTRSVLFRSAAALAKRCNQYREAERLVCMGLAGNPPHEIAEELRDLFEEVNYRRHLETKGYRSSSSVFQMSFSGSEIGPGMAQKNEIVNRVNGVSSNVYRIAQRKRGDSFTRDIPAKLKKELILELSVPKAASFAVAFRILYSPPKDQPMLPGLGWCPEEVIDELMTCTALLQTGNMEGLRERFRDEAYLTSFLTVSQLVAPDGERVKQVGFTSWRDGNERQIILDKPARALQELKKDVMLELQSGPGTETIAIEGRLLKADSTNSEKGSQLEVIDDKRKRYNIVMKEGAGDIVKNFYEEQVSVRGDFDGRQILNAVIEQIS